MRSGGGAPRHCPAREGGSPGCPTTSCSGINIARYTESAFGYTFTKLEYIEIALRGLDADEYLAAGPVLGAALAALMRPGPGGRVELKVQIVDRLRRSGLDEARLFLLVNFVQTYLELTAEEQAEVRERTFPEGDESVEAVELTWADRLIQQGLEQGREQGIAQGTLQTKRATVPVLVRAHFETAPADLEARLADLDEPALDRLLGRVVRVASLEEFLAGLP